jgi:hypothetical protein
VAAVSELSRVPRIAFQGLAVEGLEEADFGRLLLLEHVHAGRGVRQRVRGIDVELDGRVHGPEVGGGVGPVPAAAHVGALTQHDERRKVVVERPQAPMHPRADRRVVAVEEVVARVELVLGAMVVVRAPARPHDRQVVDVAADVRPPVGDLDPALAALPVAHLQWVEAGHQLPPRDELLHIPPVVGGLEHGVAVGRLGDRLARVLGKRGLGVETLHVAHAAEHEDPDHALGARRKVGVAVGRHPRGVVAQCDAVPREHGPHGQAGEAEAAVGEEAPPRAAALGSRKRP